VRVREKGECECEEWVEKGGKKVKKSERKR
jgi:hypothetical protein